MALPHALRATGLACALFMFGGAASASDNPAMDAQVGRIDSEWARIKYQVKDSSQQYQQLHALAQRAGQVVAKYPGRAEPLLWQGIVTSEEAASAGMFQKLGLAKAARALLEKARSIDPKAGNGGVAMSLGVLYYRVPGSPIGFGSTPKARNYLEAALAIDPNGLDSNFFYGEFLENEGDHAGAKAHLLRALKAPANPERPVWDAGRRAEVRALLAKVERHRG